MNSTLTHVSRAARPVAASAGKPAAGGRRTPLVLMAAGVAVTIAALGLFATAGSSGPDRSTTRDADFKAARTTAITVSGPDGVAVHRMGYGPHESSHWHRHSGLHAIAVLSGTLTVYGPDCQPARFGPGQSYIGGQGLHLARNETDEPVEMSVTYLFEAGVLLQNFVIPSAAPAGCHVS